MKHKNLYLAGGIFAALGLFFYTKKTKSEDGLLKAIKSNNRQKITIPPDEAIIEKQNLLTFDTDFYKET